MEKALPRSMLAAAFDSFVKYLDKIKYLPPHGASLKTTASFWLLYLGKTWQPLK